VDSAPFSGARVWVEVESNWLNFAHWAQRYSIGRMFPNSTGISAARKVGQPGSHLTGIDRNKERGGRNT